MGENVSHIEESLHNAKAFLRSLTSPDDDIANAVIAEIDKAMFESLPALARKAEALERENAELREAMKVLAALDRMSRGVDWCDQDEQARRWEAARRVLEGSENAE